MDEGLLQILTATSTEEESIKSGEALNRRLYTAGEDFIVSEARLFGGKSGISVRTHTRFTEFPLHRHSYVEMMIVLQGSITHIIGGAPLTLSEGEVLIMNKHLSHAVKKASESDIGVNIIMSDSFIGSLVGELGGTLFSPLIKENSKPDGEGMYLHFSTGGEKRLANLVENILYELTVGKGEMQIMRGTLTLFLNYLSLENTALLLGGNAPTDRESRRVAEIAAYIRGEYRTATLTELAERMYLTPPYLSRLVADYFGKSFKCLVVEERMKRASELICGTDLPISEIIRSVGYENESYFHREFKRYSGTTPLSYRKRNKITSEPTKEHT